MTQYQSPPPYSPESKQASCFRTKGSYQSGVSDLTDQFSSSSQEELRHALRDLALHQVELEGQNEELRRTQDERDTSQTRYFDFYDMAPVGYLTIGGSGLIEQANLTAAALLVREKELLLQQMITQFIHPDDQDNYYLMRQRIIKTNEPQSCELRFVRKDNTNFWAHLDALAVPDHAGTPSLRIVLTDITERVLGVEALTAAEAASLERFHAYFDHAIVGLAVTSPEKYWIEVNDALCETLGYTRDELTHLTWTELTYPEDLAPNLAQFNRMLAGEIESYTLDKRFIHKKGHLVDTRLAVSHVRKPDGNVDYVVAMVDDISERKQAENALREAHDIFDRSAAVAFLWKNEQDGPVEFVSNNVTALFGYTVEEFTSGRLVYSSLVHPQDIGRVGQEVVRYSAEEGATKFTHVPYRIISKDGQVKWVSDDTVIRRDAGGRITHYQGVLIDITASKLAQEKLQLAASVFDHTREGIMITDLKGSIVDVNEAFTRITGYSREDAMGQNTRILSSGRQSAEFYKEMWNVLTEQGHWSGEIWNRRKDGEVYAEMLTISATRDGQGRTQQYVGLFSDITASKAHESQLEHMAHYDVLTNLPNRALLADRLQQAMAQAQRRQQQLAVAYLDLDGFKAINDHHGHETGDQMLITLATRLKEALRESDTMARMGGDEFVAVLTDLEDTSASVDLLNRLLAAAAMPVQVGDLSLQISASLGVTFYPQAQDIEADQLLRQADQAMYQAKVAGKNRYCVFDAAQDISIRDHHESLERIRLALERHEFVLYYQPKVNMRSGKVIGAEALIRWQHPEKGLLGPPTFLHAIEDHPLAVTVGEWVIDTAMRQMVVWHGVGLDLPVSVNLGARQLLQVDFVERLQAILAKHPQVQPGCIELEVLETSALADMAQASQVIDDCASIGVKFALDDFGTGYSSLTYLKRLRVAQLKIDQSFVRDMLEDPDDLAILKGVIGLAAAFKREVIAEGVETVAHGTALLQLGCELAQGYGIARPMPAQQMPEWVAKWRPDPAWTVLPQSSYANRFLDK